MRFRKLFALLCAAIVCAGAGLLGGCGLAGQRSRPYGIATVSMAVCQILDRLDIDEVVGVPAIAEDIDLPRLSRKDRRSTGRHAVRGSNGDRQ